jgi:hypothetical protein
MNTNNPVGADPRVRPEQQIKWSSAKPNISRFENFIQSLVTGRTQGSPLRGVGNELGFCRGDACHRPVIHHLLNQNTTKRVISRFA